MDPSESESKHFLLVTTNPINTAGRFFDESGSELLSYTPSLRGLKLRWQERENLFLADGLLSWRRTRKMIDSSGELLGTYERIGLPLTGKLLAKDSFGRPLFVLVRLPGFGGMKALCPEDETATFVDVNWYPWAESKIETPKLPRYDVWVHDAGLSTLHLLVAVAIHDWKG
jgi:hypothetical protein